MQNSLKTNKPNLLLLALLASACAMPAFAQGVKEHRAVTPIDLVPASEREATLDTPPALDAPKVSAIATKPVAAVEDDDDTPKTVVLPKDPGISVMTVSHISLDTLGLYDASKGGVAVDSWNGSTHNRVKEMLAALPDAIPSRSVRGLVSRLLLSVTTPPQSENIQQNLLHERVLALMLLGQADQAVRLLELIPKDQRSEPIQRDLFAAHLVQGDDAWVCQNIAAALAEFDASGTGDVAWQTYSIFCMAKDGKTAETQLALDVLREQQRELGGALEEMFLVKSGNLSKLEAKLPEPVSLLHSAMAVRLGMAAFSDAYVKEAPLPIAQLVSISSELPEAMQEAASHRLQALDADEKVNADSDQHNVWLRKVWKDTGSAKLNIEKLATDLERKTSSAEDDDATRKLRRYRLYEVSSALGLKIEADAAPWKQGATEVKQRVVSASLRAALRDAVQAEKKGEAVLLLAMIVGQVGDLAEMHDGTLAELIHALRDIGMPDAAEALAAEAVIALF